MGSEMCIRDRNNIDKTKVEDNKPTRCLFTISLIIVSKKPDVLGGNKPFMNAKNSSWKFSTGTNGIKFRKKSKKGNIAINRLKEIAEALVVKAPLIIPLRYIFPKSNNDKPLNPGIIIFFNNSNNNVIPKVLSNLDLNTLFIYTAFKLRSKL